MPVQAEERMLRHFEGVTPHPDNGPERVGLSTAYSRFAHTLCETIPAGPERTVALRKLLESHDSAARALERPGC